MDNFLGTKF